MSGRSAAVLHLPKVLADRGRLLDAAQVQVLIGGTVPPSLDWIYAHVPGKHKLSHRCVRWFENDIRLWLEGLT